MCPHLWRASLCWESFGAVIGCGAGVTALEDGVSIFISWAMIVTMLIYIYPLKAIFSAMWFLVSGGRVGHVLGRVFRIASASSFRSLCVGIHRHRAGNYAPEFARVAIAVAVTVECTRTSN